MSQDWYCEKRWEKNRSEKLFLGQFLQIESEIKRSKLMETKFELIFERRKKSRGFRNRKFQFFQYIHYIGLVTVKIY